MLLVNLARGNNVEVTDLQAASNAVSEFINENALGSSNFTGGNVKDNGKIIAKVSYNGKVWPPGKWTPESKPLNLK